MTSQLLEYVSLKLARRAAFAGAVLVSCAAGCATKSPYVPFSISTEEFQKTANRIAIAPVLAPEGIEVADSSLAQIDELIESVLLGAGYSCVSVSEYTDVWDRILTQMGGLYDSVSGEIDELRLEVAREQHRRDLSDLYRPDYVIFPEIWFVQAAANGGVAKWDGASQPLVGFGTRVLNFIDAMLNQSYGFLQPEMVNALSLGVVVENMDGVEVFEHSGGIEVLKHLDDSEGFDAVLRDSQRNLRAVQLALQPILQVRTENQSDTR